MVRALLRSTTETVLSGQRKFIKKFIPAKLSNDLVCAGWKHAAFLAADRVCRSKACCSSSVSILVKLNYRICWFCGWVINYSPCEQLFFFTEEEKRRLCLNRASTLWSRRSPKFWTSQSCFFSSNRFVQCEHPFNEKSDGYNWARCTMKNEDGGEIWHIRLGFQTISCATCSAYSIKILLDSCRVFLENTNIEQAKERLC